MKKREKKWSDKNMSCSSLWSLVVIAQFSFLFAEMQTSKPTVMKLNEMYYLIYYLHFKHHTDVWEKQNAFQLFNCVIIITQPAT